MGEKLAKSEEELESVISNPKYVNCDLHEFGYEQARSLSQCIADLDIEVVFVSPLCRALQTATTIFKDNLNLEKKGKKIKFIVIPLICESLCNADDIFNASEGELIEKYS